VKNIYVQSVSNGETHCVSAYIARLVEHFLCFFCSKKQYKKQMVMWFLLLFLFKGYFWSEDCSIRCECRT